MICLVILSAAFIHMLESPIMTHQWINDPETGPILVLISRIYHSEKHAVAQAASEASFKSAIAKTTTDSSSTQSATLLMEEDVGSSVDPDPETRLHQLRSRSSHSTESSSSYDSVDGAASSSSVESSDQSPTRSFNVTNTGGTVGLANSNTTFSRSRSRPERDSGTPLTSMRKSDLSKS